MNEPKYPNQQLRSVSLETFFPGRVAALSKLDQFQNEFGERLPHLFVPNASPGRALAIQPYQFRSKALFESGESVAIAVNQATYVSYEYPGYDKFLEAAAEPLASAYAIFGIEKLSRVTYRYENLIAIQRFEGMLALGSVVTPLLPAAYFESLADIRTMWTSNWAGGQTTVSAVVEKIGGVDVLRLDVAATVDPGGAVSDFKVAALTAHDQATECFESLITDEFRCALAGDDLEDDDA